MLVPSFPSPEILLFGSPSLPLSTLPLFKQPVGVFLGTEGVSQQGRQKLSNKVRAFDWEAPEGWGSLHRLLAGSLALTADLSCCFVLVVKYSPKIARGGG